MLKKFTKTEWAWAFYDWANSAFATSVMAGFFPIFFKTYYANHLPKDESTFWLGTTVAVSSAIAAILNPVLGFWADLLNRRKMFAILSASFSGICLIILFKLQQQQWVLAVIGFGIGLLGFNLSMSFYDALLKFVTTPDREHIVSALGYALGYLGGGLLFLLNVVMIQRPDWFGFSNQALAIKWSFLSVAIWWFIFSLPMWLKVKESGELMRTWTAS